MRKLIVMFLLAGLIGGCSADQIAEGPRATVKQAPSTLEQVETTASAAPTSGTPTSAAPVSAPPTSAPPTAPMPTTEPPKSVLTTSIVPGGYTATNADEAAVLYLAGNYLRITVEQIVNKTFDLDYMSKFASGQALKTAEDLFGIYRTGDRYGKWGSVMQTIATDVVVTGDVAVSKVCERNDAQTWDSRGTPAMDDDILERGTLLVSPTTYEFVKRGEKWIVTSVATPEDGGYCKSVF